MEKSEEQFYQEVNKITGKWDEDQVTEMIMFVSDGPMDQGYPENWFAIPNDNLMWQRVEKLIKEWYPNKDFHREVWTLF